MLIWLPEQGFQLNTYKHNAVYIPARVFENPGYCYCSLEKADLAESKCTFCGDPLMDVIQNSIDQGKVLPQMTCCGPPRKSFLLKRGSVIEAEISMVLKLLGILYGLILYWTMERVVTELLMFCIFSTIVTASLAMELLLFPWHSICCLKCT